MSTAIIWFRGELRLADNPALAAACAAHECILPVYIHAPLETAPWSPGAASRWWLHRSLRSLDASLSAQGGALQIGQGDSFTILGQWIAETGAEAVYWNRQYEPAAIARDTVVKAALRAEGVAVHSHSGNLWCEPWRVATADDQPYRVFTPYWRKLRSLITPEKPLPQACASKWVQVSDSVPLDALRLNPRIAWDAGLAEAWQPGEAGARELLEIFADDALAGYAHGRDLPARHGTSQLSPHLHFGEISPRQIYWELDRHVRDQDGKRRPDIEPYLRELGWREFAHHLLFHFPDTPTANFNPRFDAYRWAGEDPRVLDHWRHGATGIPLVDAGLRELWHTGWMHNRVRMVVASFLTKNLRQHWHHGARWFWDTLVDADLANNSMGWQWVAGCGADAAPYFRVFNPVTQARKFDPDGAYLRRWLPELAHASLDLLNEPWKDPTLLKHSGYPSPLVDLADSRKAALGAWEQLRGA